MKKMWNSFSTINKLTLVLIISGLFTMIIGLSLIGSIDHGFSILNILGVSEVLNMSNTDFGDSGLSTLKTGIIFAVVFTPILLGLGIILFVYNQIKKTQNINNFE